MPTQRKIIYALSTLVAIIGLILGFQNRQDPFWDQLDNQLASDYKTLDKSPDELQTLYEQIHGASDEGSTTAIEILSNPFLPIMEYAKFEKYFNYLKEHRFAIFSGVTGAGGTTLIENIAKIIAPKPDNLLQLICTPNFDLNLHYEYIGQEVNGTFIKGKLLRFWDRCIANPNQSFLMIIDDLDKINPESFFGPYIWRLLDESSYEVKLGGETVIIPENFFMIMSVHGGEGSRIELNNEHFKRLGGKVVIEPEYREMIIYLQDKKEELRMQLKTAKTSSEKEIIESDLANLDDTKNLKRHIYVFQKTNEIIAANFSQEFQIGQWSNLRELYRPENQKEVISTFSNHVNALSRGKDFTESQMSPINYTIRTNGKVKGSNPIAMSIAYLEEKGFLTEFLAGIMFMLITALLSWYFFRKKIKYVNRYTQTVYEIANAYNDGTMSYEKASKKLINIKKEVDSLVLDRQISYTEAVFFYNFIEDRTKRIELSRSVHDNFSTLVETFLDDGVLEEREYANLKKLLENIRFKISNSDYEKYKSRIDELYKEYHEWLLLKLPLGVSFTSHLLKS